MQKLPKKHYMSITKDKAREYYIALGKKDFSTVEKFLHPQVQFKGPLSEMSGKEAVLENIKKFGSLFESLKIQDYFGEDEKAVVIYHVFFPSPIGAQSSVALLNFKNDLITNIELFFDARPFLQK